MFNKSEKQYNTIWEISIIKTKIMPFRGKEPITTKMMIGDRILEQVSNFNYLGNVR